MRFRDDKPQGNHRSVVENIIQSIADGVEKEAVSSLLTLSYIFSLTVTLASRAFQRNTIGVESPPWAAPAAPGTTPSTNPSFPGNAAPSFASDEHE